MESSNAEVAADSIWCEQEQEHIEEEGEQQRTDHTSVSKGETMETAEELERKENVRQEHEGESKKGTNLRVWRRRGGSGHIEISKEERQEHESENESSEDKQEQEQEQEQEQGEEKEDEEHDQEEEDSVGILEEHEREQEEPEQGATAGDAQHIPADIDDGDGDSDDSLAAPRETQQIPGGDDDCNGDSDGDRAGEAQQMPTTPARRIPSVYYSWCVFTLFSRCCCTCYTLTVTIS